MSSYLSLINIFSRIFIEKVLNVIIYNKIAMCLKGAVEKVNLNHTYKHQYLSGMNC